ncbi:hypothetical protein, partial [Parachitinimonas caeni]
STGTAGSTGGTGSAPAVWSTDYRLTRYYYLNGQRIGDVSNQGASREDYAQSLARQWGGYRNDERYTQWKPVDSADFDQNYEPISPSYPAAVPGRYIVQSGDSLR